MDALFGLPRKKSAGKSFRNALHRHIFFGRQESVDEFVEHESSSKVKKPVKVCSRNLIAIQILKMFNF